MAVCFLPFLNSQALTWRLDISVDGYLRWRKPAHERLIKCATLSLMLSALGFGVYFEVDLMRADNILGRKVKATAQVFPPLFALGGKTCIRVTFR